MGNAFQKAMPPSKRSVMTGVAPSAPGPSEAQPLWGLSGNSTPLECPLHVGGKGWSITEPCLACIALAMGEQPVRPSISKRSPAVSLESTIAKASKTDLALQEEGTPVPRLLGEPAPSNPPPPPSPVACSRHRRGGGWSLCNPCQDCLELAMSAEL